MVGACAFATVALETTAERGREEEEERERREKRENREKREKKENKKKKGDEDQPNEYTYRYEHLMAYKPGNRGYRGYRPIPRDPPSWSI